MKNTFGGKAMGANKIIECSRGLKPGQFNMKDIWAAIEWASRNPQARIPKPYSGGCHKIMTPSLKSRKRDPNYSSPIVEGTLERNSALLLEFDPLVSHFKAQPFTLYYHNGDTIAWWIPDFLAWGVNAPPLLIEVKEASAANDPSTRQKHDFRKLCVESTGIRCRLITSAECSLEPRISNLRKLSRKRYRNGLGTLGGDIARDNLIAALKKNGGSATYGKLIQQDPEISEHAVALCLYEGSVLSSHKFPVGPLLDLCLA